MILEFSVKNFRSIKDLQTVSFLSTSLNSNIQNEEVDRNNIVENGDYRILKTVGIYGANASGKSNIIHAFSSFLRIVKSLPSPESTLNKYYDPYLFQDKAEESDIYFQVIVLVFGKKYRYGFTFSNNKITNEWLYGPANKNQVKYYTRSYSDGQISIGETFSGEVDSIPEIEYEHLLFLTHIASYKANSAAKNIWDYFKHKTLPPISNVNILRSATINLLKDDNDKKYVLNFLSSFGINYSDIFVKDDDEKKSDSIPEEKIFLTKKIASNNNESVKDFNLNLRHNESLGTRKLFNLAGILMAIIKTGTFICIDELDSSFHPSLLIKLIEMFNNPSINTGNAQLLFTSHETALMSPKLMRRDQFFFAEKDSYEATRIYALSDLKGIRNDADFARQYLAGFYGGVPVLNNYIEPNTSLENE